MAAMSGKIWYEEEAKKRGAAFKYGLMVHYLRKFSFEDQDHMSNSEFYKYYGYRDIPAHEPPNAHEVVMKFLKQVRDSNGYDVDCVPILDLNSPFRPLPIDKIRGCELNKLMRATHFAINKINFEMGNHYVLVKVDKIVATIFLILLTFTVKEENQEVVDSAQLKILRAMVNWPLGPREDVNRYTLMEWMNVPPPAVVNPEILESMESKEKKAIIGEGNL